MKPIGTEGLDLFCGRTQGEALLAQGQRLRDSALARSREGRENRIVALRGHLLDWRDATGEREFTADTVHRLATLYGYAEGDTRYLGNVVKGWPVVKHTGRYVPSTLAKRHARPVAVWMFVSPSP